MGEHGVEVSVETLGGAHAARALVVYADAGWAGSLGVFMDVLGFYISSIAPQEKGSEGEEEVVDAVDGGLVGETFGFDLLSDG